MQQSIFQPISHTDVAGCQENEASGVVGKKLSLQPKATAGSQGAIAVADADDAGGADDDAETKDAEETEDESDWEDDIRATAAQLAPDYGG